jgi:hypothetical protein
VQLLAVGDKQGTLHILEIPRTLRRPVAQEENLMLALLTREQVSFIYSLDVFLCVCVCVCVCVYPYACMYTLSLSLTHTHTHKLCKRRAVAGGVHEDSPGISPAGALGQKRRGTHFSKEKSSNYTITLHRKHHHRTRPLTFQNMFQDEARRIEAELSAAKAAVEEAAAREAAEAQAAALVEGDGVVEEQAEEEASAGSALSAEEEAAQGSHTECVFST